MNQLAVPFFTLPQNLVRAGILPKMKPCELFLTIALHHEMERLSNPAFIVTNAALHNLTGLSPSAIRLGRTKLMERGIVSLKRVAGGMYEYSLLNPSTGRPWPRRRRSPGSNGLTSSDPGSSESREEFYKPVLSEPKREPSGVPLDFGDRRL